MSRAPSTAFHPEKAQPTTGSFSRHEVELANRNSGILLEALRHDVTPVGLHYLLVHFDVPYVASETEWSLSISGRVNRPQQWTLGALRGFPERTLRVTLECAGNGRAGMTPRWQSQPWYYEAVGTSEWTGTPLKHLLEQAELQASARDVAFIGKDRGFDAGVVHNYSRSLSPAHSLHDDVLVAWAMNGKPLLPQHGFPLRLVVPGWYGMASVKWLDRIEVLDRPFDGFQQVGTYIYRQDAGEPGTPVTTIRVKSLMVPPGLPDWYSRHRLLQRGPVQLVGRAWSGAGVPIAQVEVAVDGRWCPATLAPEVGQYAWRGWSFDWDATAGEHVLMCRATDANGETQPIEQRFDRGGFGNNAVHRVQVAVR